MEKNLVHHHNYIGHEINESLEYYAEDVFDREIYCRKIHLVKEPLKKDCMNCPYAAGWEQGHGYECVWEDVTEEHYVVPHEDRYKEYERVDRLMKLGVLDNKSLITKVKNADYDKDKWIYAQSEDCANRYLLGTRGKKTLICCGVNPSYASPGDLDPTMRNVEYFAEKHGYDSYVMINLYPMRATNPKDMHKIMDESIVKANEGYIKELLSGGDCSIWAAWGTIIEERPYLKECLERIVKIADKHQCEWYTIGTKSKKNHPHHPLYLNRECEMDLFDIHAYVRDL